MALNNKICESHHWRGFSHFFYGRFSATTRYPSCHFSDCLSLHPARTTGRKSKAKIPTPLIKYIMKIALVVVAFLIWAAVSAALQQATMRTLYQIDNELTQIVVLSTSSIVVHIVGTQTCDESELANVAVPHSSSIVNQTFQLVASNNQDSISIFYVDFTQQEFQCWCVLHSESVVVGIIDRTGEQIDALFSNVELVARDVGRDVQGETVGAIIILCTVPVILALAAFMYSAKVKGLAHCGVVGELFLQSFSSGALVAIIVIHLYPEMVSALDDAEEPQWKGGAVILGGVCTLVAAQMLSAQLNSHHHHNNDDEEQQQQPSKPAKADKPLVPSAAVLRRMAGDSVHNLVYGAIVASAFLSCGISVGWLTLGAMVAHAIPMHVHAIRQMVGENVGCTLTQAAFFSTLAKLAALVGMGIVLALDRWLGNVDAALMLGYAIGTFFFISLTTIMPTLVIGVRTRCQAFSILFGFGVALVAIGLSTMLEQTC